MEVILREEIGKLGRRGDVVKVASGYARNYLLPNRLAVAATEATRRSSSRSARRICGATQKKPPTRANWGSCWGPPK